ncbi:protoporphyrinogen oxidase [Alicyclobacillus curvatus]|nr:protoporphyrinogen oxidase [Alicyclobacillus curvatus]
METIYSSKEMKTGILRNDRLFTLPPGMTFGLPTKLSTFAFNSLIPLSGKIRGLGDLVLPKDTTTVDKSVGEILRRRIGDDLVNILAEPMLAGIHAGSIDRLSVNAVAPYLRKMERDNGSLIRAMLKQGKQSAKSSKKGVSTPSFVSVRNGLQQLVDTIVEKLQSVPEVALRTKADVTQVVDRPDGGFQVRLNNEGGREESLEADAVLLCVPAFSARRLIPATDPEFDWLLEIPYVSTATVSLAYPIQMADLDLRFTGFLVPRGEDEMLTACTVVSRKWSRAVRNGFFVVRGYVGRDGEQQAMGKPDEEIIDHMKAQMRKHFGVTVDPIWSIVDRWPQSMPQYLVGHGEKLKDLREKISEHVPGMYLAGAGYDGMSISDCIRQGRQAMKNCLSLKTDA